MRQYNACNAKGREQSPPALTIPVIPLTIAVLFCHQHPVHFAHLAITFAVCPLEKFFPFRASENNCGGCPLHDPLAPNLLVSMQPEEWAYDVPCALAACQSFLRHPSSSLSWYLAQTMPTAIIHRCPRLMSSCPCPLVRPLAAQQLKGLFAHRANLGHAFQRL